MLGKSSTQSASNHVESALDDAESTDDEADVEGVLRTGNGRFRRGSRHLSRLSSTLGEGITAHWKKSESSPLKTDTPAPSASESSKAAPSSTLVVNTENDKAGHRDPSPASLPPSAGLPDVHAETRKSTSATATETLSPIEQAKRLAAYRAVDVHVKPHHRVIGIGSGSTVPYVVDRLLEQGEEANRKRWVRRLAKKSDNMVILNCVTIHSSCPLDSSRKSSLSTQVLSSVTSVSTNMSIHYGGGLTKCDTPADQFPVIDVTIDGADDVDLALNAIKGGGACHLREKVLAEAAEEFIIVADYRKNNMLLGQARLFWPVFSAIRD